MVGETSLWRLTLRLDHRSPWQLARQTQTNRHTKICIHAPVHARKHKCPQTHPTCPHAHAHCAHRHPPTDRRAVLAPWSSPCRRPFRAWSLPTLYPANNSRQTQPCTITHRHTHARMSARTRAHARAHARTHHRHRHSQTCARTRTPRARAHPPSSPNPTRLCFPPIRHLLWAMRFRLDL